jgi:ribonuclease P/MRP protein subunit POP5
MAKKTILMPTLREKKRYVAFEVIAKEKKQAKEVSDSIWQSCLSYIGEKGCAQAGIQILKERWDQEKQAGIIKVEHDHVNDLKAALALIKNVGNTQVVMRSTTTSGILNKAEKNS